MTRDKLRKLVGCSNSYITITFQKILRYKEKGVAENEWKLTDTQWQIHEIFQFEDKFLNEIFPSKLHIAMCLKAAEKATSKESYIKDYSLRCLKYSQYLLKKQKKKAQGLEAMLNEIKSNTTIRAMIEALEYDEDFAFKLVTGKEIIDRQGKILTPAEWRKLSAKKYEEVYPYIDVCEKALDYTKKQDEAEFVHDCMDLTRLIIARGLKE